MYSNTLAAAHVPASTDGSAETKIACILLCAGRASQDWRDFLILCGMPFEAFQDIVFRLDLQAHLDRPLLPAVSLYRCLHT